MKPESESGRVEPIWKEFDEAAAAEPVEGATPGVAVTAALTPGPPVAAGAALQASVASGAAPGASVAAGAAGRALVAAGADFARRNHRKDDWVGRRLKRSAR